MACSRTVSGMTVRDHGQPRLSFAKFHRVQSAADCDPALPGRLSLQLFAPMLSPSTPMPRGVPSEGAGRHAVTHKQQNNHFYIKPCERASKGGMSSKTWLKTLAEAAERSP